MRRVTPSQNDGPGAARPADAPPDATMAPSPRATRTRGRPPKRDAVLDAAVDAFLQGGYSGTSLEQIAREAQVSTATVFKHYRTKADIFGAIMSRVFGNDDPNTWPPVDSSDPVEGLVQIGRHYAATLREPRIRALFRVMIAEVPRFPELGQQLYERGKAPYLERVEDYLRAAVKARQLQVPDVKLATRQFLGMINDVVFWPHMLVMDLPESDAECARVVRGAARALCAAYAPAAPRTAGTPR
jgi:TetR/AcrR family transcriptional regulator, regulator of autoinduction and epiphytic fitness